MIKGKCSTILRLCCCSQGWDFISACTWISTQLGQAGLNSRLKTLNKISLLITQSVSKKYTLLKWNCVKLSLISHQFKAIHAVNLLQWLISIWKGILFWDTVSVEIFASTVSIYINNKLNAIDPTDELQGKTDYIVYVFGRQKYL